MFLQTETITVSGYLNTGQWFPGGLPAPADALALSDGVTVTLLLSATTTLAVEDSGGVFLEQPLDAFTLDAPAAPLAMQTSNTVVIAYTYDPLNRLTAADYDNGVYFHYTYDPAGNRLTQTSSLNQGNPDVYVYDSANRLTSVNGQSYTWGNNGSLLDDGVYSYVYDRANRLTGVNGAGVAATYAYNGLGERIQQTVDGLATDFIVDQAGGLTQVLSDGTDSYLYGLRRIAEQDAEGWQYYVGDALGSVRQLVNESGEMRLAKGYEPYGEVLSSAGEVESRYGFTGEWTDYYIELVNLRSRMYNPRTGRFLTKDSWPGDYTTPMSLNAWNYVGANPINFLDPTGMWRWRLAEPMYHMPIEDYYESLLGFNPNRQLEHLIPGTPFRHPDMFNSLTGDVFEIEPIFLAAIGATQVQDYVTDLNAAAQANLLVGYHLLGGRYDWNRTIFHTGFRAEWPGKFRKTPLSFAFPLVDLVADYFGSGVVVYWIEPNALAPVLLGKKLAGIVPNKRLLRPRNWIPSSAPYQPAYAVDIGIACGTALIVIGGTILVVTIVEDATVVGVVDDVVTIPTGVLLVNYGLKLATYSPVP